MEPFGFAHLRRQYVQTEPVSWPLSDREIERLKKCVTHEDHSITRTVSAAFNNLYYPVNTPSCQYQKQLIIESLFYNLLIALPKEFDSFFVASVVMINFRRWFPQKKVVYIGVTLEMIRNMICVFMDITGCDRRDICVYGDQKKSDRFAEWNNCGIVFATAEIVLSDVKEGIDGAEVSLLVVDEAQRAMIGSHPVCELVRSFILSKGKFRILALTDHRIMKVPSLQLIVMNLQIGLIRSQCSFKNAILYTICSPLMRDIYVSITPEMGSIADALIEAISRLISIMSEGDVLPSGSLQQLANYSLRSLRKTVELRMPHLLDIFKDAENLFIIYDSLMCDGITAFACAVQSIITQSATIEHIIESNVHLKEAFLRRDLSKTNELCSHKSTSLLKIIENALHKYRADLMRGQKLVVVLLCRNRGTSYNAAVVAILKKHFAQTRAKINAIVYERRTRAVQSFSERSLLAGVCTVIVCPCDSQPIELNVGYVDLLVCMDEGLSSLYYTSKINMSNDAELYAIRTNAYETNIRPLTSEASCKECVDERTMRGVQLCTDNPQLFHRIQIPKIIEFWSTKRDENSGMLSTLDRLAFEERLNADGGKDVYENIVHNARDVLRKGMDSALLWQSRPQQCHEIGHSKATFTLAKFVGASSEEISSITERLNNQRVIDNKWSVEDEHLEDAQPKTSGIKGVPSLKKQSPHQVMNTKTNKMKRKRPEAPPVLRIDSASFGSFFKKPTKLSADSFVNRLDEASSYSIRQKQMLSVIDKLRDLIRM